MKGSVTLKQTPAAAILREMALRPKHVIVGVIGKRAAAKHKDTEMTTAEVAAINHMGITLPNGAVIPSRPFLTIAMERKAAQIAKTRVRIARQLMQGKIDYDTALGLLGEVCVNAVKETIAEGVPPPNAESTILAKRSSTPLINRGQLRASVAYQVREGK